MLNKISILLLIISSTQIFGEWNPPTLKDEKVVLLFHCDLLEGQGKESIEKIWNEEKEKSQRELGTVFYFHFPFLQKEKKRSELLIEEDFKLRSGYFQYTSDFLFSATNTYFTKSPLFLVHFTEEEYEKVKDKETKKPHFIFLREGIPNQFRYYGNTSYISCPNIPAKLGKLTLHLREGQIIRKNLEYVSLTINYGDF